MVTITDLPDAEREELDRPGYTEAEMLAALDHQQLATYVGHTITRVDGNFQRIEEAYRHLLSRVEALTKKPPRRRARSGSAARVNPDQLSFGYVIAALNGLFVAGVFVLVYAGQYAFAKYTQLPQPLWIFIPIALDLPVVSASFTAAIFLKRRQPKYALANWVVVFGLTVLGSVIQVTHVLVGAGWFNGEPITFPDILGALIMGLFPWLTMYLSHNLARLLVRPTGETIDPAEKAPVRKRRPAAKKTRSTK